MLLYGDFRAEEKGNSKGWKRVGAEHKKQHQFQCNYVSKTFCVGKSSCHGFVLCWVSAGERVQGNIEWNWIEGFLRARKAVKGFFGFGWYYFGVVYKDIDRVIMIIECYAYLPRKDVFIRIIKRNWIKFLTNLSSKFTFIHFCHSKYCFVWIMFIKGSKFGDFHSKFPSVNIRKFSQFPFSTFIETTVINFFFYV